jgi:multicomponent Na+:H+ antiporter subunit F
MLTIAFGISAFFMGLATLLTLVRLLKGPTPLDRLLAFDLLNTVVVGLIAVFALYWSEVTFLETLLMFSLFGFLSVSTTVFFLERTLEDRSSEDQSSEGRSSEDGSFDGRNFGTRPLENQTEGLAKS